MEINAQWGTRRICIIRIRSEREYMLEAETWKHQNDSQSLGKLGDLYYFLVYLFVKIGFWHLSSKDYSFLAHKIEEAWQDRLKKLLYFIM